MSVKSGNRPRFRLKTSRTSLLILLRCTLLPNFLLTAMPSLVRPRRFGLYKISKLLVWIFRPPLCTLRNSDLLSKRDCFGNVSATSRTSDLRSLVRRELDGESGSPFAPTPLDDPAPTFCSHPGEKSVYPFPPATARLIGSFQGRTPLSKKPSIRTTARVSCQDSSSSIPCLFEKLRFSCFGLHFLLALVIGL